MTRSIFFATVMGLLFLSSRNSWCAEPAPALEEVSRAIEKALPYVQERGQWWIDKKECMSCHRVAFTAWSHVAADNAGINVDREQVDEWIDWCHENLFEPFPEEDQKFPGEMTIERNLSGAAQMLAVVSRWDSSANQREFSGKILDKLRDGHSDDGRFHPRGQLPGQKRALDETAQVVTMWNTMFAHDALENDLKTTDDEPVELFSGAAKFLASFTEEGKSTEWLALRAAWENRFGDTGHAADWKSTLLDEQRDDGGWGWIRNDESDVLATAQVLYLLIESDFGEDESTARAAAYLLAEQKKNGAWKVFGTKEKAKDRIQETASYWGSAWAVIALSRYVQANSTSPEPVISTSSVTGGDS